MRAPSASESKRDITSAAPTIGNAARGDHGEIREGVNNLRNQGQGRAGGPMATSFSALSHENVGPCRRSFSGLGQRLNLTDELCACLLDLGRKWARVTKREHHCRRLMLEGQVEQIRLLG